MQQPKLVTTRGRSRAGLVRYAAVPGFIFRLCVTVELYFLASSSNEPIHATSAPDVAAPTVLSMSSNINGVLSKKNKKNQLERYKDEDDRSLRSCRLLLENKMDYHYEVIESAAVRFPVRWDKIKGCDSRSKPILVDIGLAIPAMRKKTLSEAAGFEKYFRESLQGTIVSRRAVYNNSHFSDQYYPATNTTSSVQRPSIEYNQLVDLQNMSATYDARIGITCDSYNYLKWIRRSPTNYCIKHESLKSNENPKASLLRRICWLNPMHAPNCYFMPIDLPQFPSKNRNEQVVTREDTTANDSAATVQDPIGLCTIGKDKNHELLANALQVGNFSKHTVHLHIFARFQKYLDPYQKVIENSNSSTTSGGPVVELVRQDDFVSFQKEVYQRCQILLPLLDPTQNPQYYPTEADPKRKRRSTGSMAQAIGYRIPTVQHVELANIYRNHLTAPVQVYNDTPSFVQALENMVYFVASKNHQHQTAARSHHLQQ